MAVRYSKFLPSLFAFGDAVILNIFFIVGFIYDSSTSKWLNFDFIAFFVYLNIIWFALSAISGSYKEDARPDLKRILLTSGIINIVYFFFFLLFFQIKSLNYYDRDLIEYIFMGFTATNVFWRLVLYYLLIFYRKLGYNYRNAIIVGNNNSAESLESFFANNKFTGHRLLGIFFHEKLSNELYKGSYDNLMEFVEEQGVDEIFVAFETINSEGKETITRILNTIPIKIRFIPELTGFSYLSIKLSNFDTIPVLEVVQGPLSFWYNRLLKRSIDVFFSVLVIFGVLSWLVPLLFIISKFSSGGKLFFIQKRSGINNVVFKCIKFRTLYDNVDAHEKQVVADDDRITPLGRFLRKTNIDEIPQFINVLFNQMSIIGPRPHMLKHTDEYKNIAEKFMVRQMVKPGISGLAQVNGYRGEIQNPNDLHMRVRYDLNYIESWSVFLDLKIALLTIYKMIVGDKKAY